MNRRRWRDLPQNSSPLSAIPIPKLRSERGRERRFRSEPVVALSSMTTREEPQADLVRIALLAMETLGPASMRASFTGTEVRVAVPDDALARIFRAVLAESSRRRATDRLIRVVVGE
jgi:hypothetical protein